MSTALTTRKPDSLVTFEGVDASVLPITAENIVLIQSQSRVEGGIAGKFRNSDNGNHIDGFNAVPISLYTNRVLFPPTPPGATPQFGQQPLCRSNDGVRPAENVADKKSKLCAPCPFNQWKRVAGKSIKPQCQEKLLFTFAELETFRVFKFTASGTSIAPLKNALKNVRNEVGSAQRTALMAKKMAEANGEEYNEPTLHLGLDSFVIQMTPIRISSPSGVYYNVNFRPFLANHKNPTVFREMYQSVLKGLELAYAQKPVEEDGEEYVDSETSPEYAQTFSQESVGEPVIEA